MELNNTYVCKRCDACEAYEAAIKRELEHLNTNIKTLNQNELITLHNLNQIIKEWAND